ncbi:hypothetical protein FQZ97_1065830 [compost metagenome]
MQALQAGLAVAAVQCQAALQGSGVAFVAGQLRQALLQLGGLLPRIPRAVDAVETLGQDCQLRVVAAAQDFAVAGRRDGKTVLEMPGMEAALFGLEHQWYLAGGQHFAVVAAQEGHQQLAVEQRVR